MKIKGWLVITPSGFDRALSTEPRQLKQHERAIHLEIEVPDTLFTRPTLAARLTLEPGLPLLAALNGGRLYGSRRRIATELRTPEATVTHWLNGRGCEQERLVRRAMTMIAAAATPSPA